MVNIVTTKKLSSFNRKASLVNMRCMQEKVAAMRIDDNYREVDNSNSLAAKENSKSAQRN